MIKGMIFDFDGVILESADIKTEGFRELFQHYPHKVKKIIDYHLLNAGVSRYVKFKHIYAHILKERLSPEKEIELGKTFLQIVLKKILSAPLVAGAKEFLEQNRNIYKFFIVSGTPIKELDEIIRFRKLKGYFKEVFGGPLKKEDIIGNIINKYGFKKKEVIYIGDSKSDRLAAKKAKVTFILRKCAFQNRLKRVKWVIKDFVDLKEILQKAESGRRK